MKTYFISIAFLTFSCQMVTKGYTKLKQACSWKVQICLSVHGLLLLPSIKGLNSHKNHSMTSTLIIDSIDYENVILTIYL